MTLKLDNLVTQVIQDVVPVFRPPRESGERSAVTDEGDPRTYIGIAIVAFISWNLIILKN